MNKKCFISKFIANFAHHTTHSPEKDMARHSFSRRSTGSPLLSPYESHQGRGSPRTHHWRPPAGARSCCSGSVTLPLPLLQLQPRPPLWDLGRCETGKGGRWERRRCWRRELRRAGSQLRSGPPAGGGLAGLRRPGRLCPWVGR